MLRKAHEYKCFKRGQIYISKFRNGSGGIAISIDKHLSRDERILASARANLGGTLYATDKRVIRYKKSFFREKVDSLYYRHIVGASYESQSYVWLVALGFLLLVLGWFITRTPFIGILGTILILSGFIVIAVGIFYRSSWYQLRAVGLSDTSAQRWRTAGVDAEVKNFVRFIEDQISKREMPPPTREKEVITKEIVMVKCEYCGSLMPQTATFCPNCRARRR